MAFSNLPAGASASIKPFNISTPQETLDELRTLIKLSKIAPLTYESKHADAKREKFGISHEWLTNAREEWLKMDWRKSEDYLNSFPQFMAQIERDSINYDVHFMGLFSRRKDAIPVLYLHGWPGDFLEFIPTFALLKERYTPDDLPYHVIAPSLPGYAFSSGPSVDREIDAIDIAAIIDQLMQQLGLGNAYVAQGGDIGSGIARMLAKNHEGCKAVHVNFLSMIQPPEAAPEVNSLSVQDREGVERGQRFRGQGCGYAIEHGTRASTIGFVLQSSPIALLSWIGEKFITWSDETPNLNIILESVTLYWITNTIARCIYPYRQMRNYTPISKPLGFSSFNKEVIRPPESWVKTEYPNLCWYRFHDQGGHFAALEKPDVLLEDLEDFIREVWKE